MISKNGYNYKFDSSKCVECGGKCCTGESGYIRVTLDESEKIANLLRIELEEFAFKYLFKIGYGFSIKEKISEDGFACIFFDEKNKNCQIYEARPAQCREFPFWDIFKDNEQEVKNECPGIF